METFDMRREGMGGVVVPGGAISRQFTSTYIKHATHEGSSYHLVVEFLDTPTY
jgi:hypothetical protein